MTKLKRILALIGAILLVALYVSTLVFALMSSELAQGLFMASVFCTVAIPVLIYACMLIYKVLKGKGEPQNKNKNTDKDKEHSR